MKITNDDLLALQKLEAAGVGEWTLKRRGCTFALELASNRGYLNCGSTIEGAVEWALNGHAAREMAMLDAGAKMGDMIFKAVIA